jgi:exopolysaccharide biosynthesis polyprenyl glycosylphosphotransferase
MTMTVATLIVLLLVWSSVIRRLGLAERVLIIGTSALARELVERFAAGGTGRQRLAGVIDDLDERDVLNATRLTGPLARLGAIIADLRPDRIVVALTDRRGRLPMSALLDARVRGVVVEDGVECYERLTGKIPIESLAPSYLVSSRDFKKSHVDLAFGHALSLIVSAAALVALAPLFAVIALIIRLDSPGPVLFVQDRIGWRGRRFRLLKFRTMRPSSEPRSEWARDNEHRVTRVGRWLRKYRLDELPQLINVVRGDLNLVGPRPHPVCNFELFARGIPFYSLRSVVRPGLTGWAQVRQGYANGLEEETEKMRYDLYYIKHMSVWLDLRILSRTFPMLLSGSGSEAPMDAKAAKRPASAATSSPSIVRVGIAH